MFKWAELEAVPSMSLPTSQNTSSSHPLTVSGYEEDATIERPFQFLQSLKVKRKSKLLDLWAKDAILPVTTVRSLGDRSGRARFCQLPPATADTLRPCYCGTFTDQLPRCV